MLSTSSKSLENMARQALGDGRDEAAFKLLGELLQRQPGHAQANYLLSYIAHKYGNYEKEVELLQNAVKSEPDTVLFKAYLARALALCGQMLSSYQQLKTIDLEESDNPEVIDVVATTYNRLNLYTQACRCYQRLVKIDDSRALIWFNLSTCYKYLGEFDKTEQALEKAIELKPHYEKAQAALSLLNTRKSSTENQVAERVATLSNIQKASHHPEARLHLAHAMAKELEMVGDYSRAFSILKRHKDVQRRAIGYEFERDRALLSNLAARGSYPLAKARTVENIFVTGMPRTGTTMVERLLCSAPDLASAGELPCFRTSLRKVLGEMSTAFITEACGRTLDKKSSEEVGRLYRHNTRYLKGDCTILLDKLPLNILLTDQILHCLENSVVVCLERHPLDTIVGNYRQLFSFADGLYSYSLSLEDTARFYLCFRALTQRLARDYPDRFYRVSYEALVQNPEREAEKLFDFCQLPWKSEYVSIEKNRSPVATASALQVREKIHTRALGQWRRYEDSLTEVKRLLDEGGVSYE
ncbi:tetratricopeptide repeat-containing sulfotransferase family protein [Gilvimarinus sp. DA14]|uniref:tetratricopeptide repeat-containing sulfotransferase family protein n=1 Tax=Gilvimarinus sp. DA14 TaxID=2956798 RepID=UPI0020B77B25|nr:tetratricopeptide repeat-containing sulfotransferase family protein [Gilvimarinus sp. DA14]UTF59072.1 sulfotransferase [Gilvimarinus sp. DA14]